LVFKLRQAAGRTLSSGSTRSYVRLRNLKVLVMPSQPVTTCHSPYISNRLLNAISARF